MTSRTRLLLLAGGAALVVAIPALGQNRQAPQSILPPGFGDTQNLPPPEQKAPPAPPRPQQGSSPQQQQQQANGSSSAVAGAGTEGGALERSISTRPSCRCRPACSPSPPAERPVAMVGPLEPGSFGLGPDAFGPTDGV